MYNLDRYEFSATDSLYEKLDAKIGNYLVRSEEMAEAKHQTKLQKQREKYAKAKAKADAAEAYYSSYKKLGAESHESVKRRVLDI